MDKKAFAIGCTAAAVGAAAYAAVVRPKFLTWGATPRERARISAGDELMPEPLTVSTRAVTIDAPPEDVWPWLAQIGQDRGGFYSYTPFENAVGADMTNATEIHPEWQVREPGDKVWLAARDKFDGMAHFVVARWIPGKAIVLVAPPDWERVRESKPAQEAVWSFILEPIQGGRTRLIARSLTGCGLGLQKKVAHYLFWEPAHFVMERGMLLGVKGRVESARRSKDVRSEAVAVA